MSSPQHIHQFRCVAALQPDRAVAGSDDGFLYALRVP